MKKKLATWMCSKVSQAGRLVFLKTALDSIPVYQKNLFGLPKLVKSRLDTIQKTFLWGNNRVGDTTKNRLHLVKWSEVYKPKNQGGLEVHSIRLRNSVLLFKW